MTVWSFDAALSAASAPYLRGSLRTVTSYGIKAVPRNWSYDYAVVDRYSCVRHAVWQSCMQFDTNVACVFHCLMKTHSCLELRSLSACIEE